LDYISIIEQIFKTVSFAIPEKLGPGKSDRVMHVNRVVVLLYSTAGSYHNKAVKRCSRFFGLPSSAAYIGHCRDKHASQYILIIITS